MEGVPGSCLRMTLLHQMRSLQSVSAGAGLAHLGLRMGAVSSTLVSRVLHYFPKLMFLSWAWQGVNVTVTLQAFIEWLRREQTQDVLKHVLLKGGGKRNKKD